jgi:hypothetical protein
MNVLRYGMEAFAGKPWHGCTVAHVEAADAIVYQRPLNQTTARLCFRLLQMAVRCLSKNYGFSFHVLGAYCQRIWYTRPANNLPVPPNLLQLVTSSDSTEARSWITRFQSSSIPKDLVRMTFSRSSGPGGQVSQSCVTLHRQGVRQLSRVSLSRT